MNYSQVETALRRIGFERLSDTGPVPQPYSGVVVKNGLSYFKPFSRLVLFKGPPASEANESVLNARVQKQLEGLDTVGAVLEVRKWAFGKHPKFRDHWVVLVRPKR